MTVLYRRPACRLPLSVEPQLTSWDRVGSPGQVRLGHFLDHAAALAAPAFAGDGGLLAVELTVVRAAARAAGERLRDVGGSLVAVELTVGIPAHLPLAGGGRDLDNYLFPLAQRLGPGRIAAMFGRKDRGVSFLAIGPAEPDGKAPAQFTTRLTGSYTSTQWKSALHDQLSATAHPLPGTGPVAVTIGITTGPGRNWANIWKPLIDAFGPVLGESPLRSFHPGDDRITDLGLHHRVDPSVGHDVIVSASWASR